MSQPVVAPAHVAVTSPRLVWVDVAKALAIALVVLHHVVVFADAAGWLPERVVWLNTQLGTFRMPLFFLASGLFAVGALRRPWGAVLRRRILLFAYLYLLWSVIRFGLFQMIPDVREGGRDGDLGALLWSPLLPGTGLWFIYALALYSCLAKATMRVPAGVQLGVAAAVSGVFGARLIEVPNFAWRNMAMYYVFFLVGMYGRRVVERLASDVSVVRILAAGAVAAVGIVVVERWGLRGVPGLWLALSVVAVLTGVYVSALIARWGSAARVLSWVGARTLPIYLLHVPLVALAVALIEEGVDPAHLLGTAALPVLALTAVACSALLHEPTRRALPFLYDLPGSGRNGAVRP